jgi:PRTRC genetic system ThiF family protein
MNVHFTEPYLLNPRHRVTVNLVGLGGTGSQMLTALARINATLLALDHPGLHVRGWDPDEVAAPNIGRQLFFPTDIGINKALILIGRINRAFGYDWEAHPKEFDGSQNANILITCIDTAAGRVKIGKRLQPSKGAEPPEWAYYWLDMGNLRYTGQAVLGTVSKIKQPQSDLSVRHTLPNVLKLFPAIYKIKEKDQGPSCSLAEAIGKQDLFINSALAQFGADLLWKLFREGMIQHQGCYVNLQTFQVNPISIK